MVSTSSTVRMPLTHGERDEHLVGGAFDHVHHGGGDRTRRGDVEERQFVGAFAVVAFGQFDGPPAS